MNKTGWANPLPAGLVALAVACFSFYALLSGAVDHSATPLLGCWLIGGFVIQLTVAIIDLKCGNVSGGNAFLFFSAFFMLVGGMEMLIKPILDGHAIAYDSRIDGYAWMVLTFTLWMWTPAFFRTKLLPIVLFIDFSMPFITLMDLKKIGAEYSVYPAYGLGIAGVLAIYLAASIVVNSARGRDVYPTHFFDYPSWIISKARSINSKA